MPAFLAMMEEPRRGPSPRKTPPDIAPHKAGEGGVLQPPPAASQGCWPQVANPRPLALGDGLLLPAQLSPKGTRIEAERPPWGSIGSVLLSVKQTGTLSSCRNRSKLSSAQAR